MDKVLVRIQWAMWALMMALFIADALLGTRWLFMAAWVPIGVGLLINTYWAVRVVALVVGHRRERKAANAAAHARMLHRRNGEVA